MQKSLSNSFALASWKSRFILGSLLFHAARAYPSTINIDYLTVSTVAAQSSAGIEFSSSVYVSANSSITLSGAAGAITSASSITASSLWGEGRYLSGISNSILTATQTFSGSNTFTSSINVQSAGRVVILSTSANSENLTISSDGTITFNPVLHASSHTIIPNSSTTSDTFASCIDGSTITIIANGGRVEVQFTGTADSYQHSPTSGLQLTVLQDGQFPPGLNDTMGLSYGASGTPPIRQVAFSYLFAAVTPGAHSYCLAMARGGVVGTGTAVLANDTYTSNIFYVKEIR